MLVLSWNHNLTWLGPNEAVNNFFPIHSKEVGHEGQLPREYASVFKSLQFLTAATLLGQSKWRESRESARRGDRGGGGVSIWGGLRASDQGVWGVYGCVFSRRFQWDHRGLCSTTAVGVIVDLVKSCLGGLRGLGSGCLGCLWKHLFIAVPMTPPAATFS